MNRRGFLAAIVGLAAAPFVPRQRWTWNPARIAFVPSGLAPVIINKRVIYAKVRITRAMLAGEHGAWNRAVDAEWAGVIQDMERRDAVAMGS